jgi:hypothetical protein
VTRSSVNRRLSDEVETLSPQSTVETRQSQMSDGTVRLSTSTNAKSVPSTVITSHLDLTKSGRTVLILFEDNGQTRHSFLHSVGDIEESLAQAQGPALRRQLYLLEGPRPDHAAAMEKHFKIQPSFFKKHARASEREVDHRAKETPLLPSLVDPQKTWCLDYHVLRSFEHDWKSHWVRCAENGRRLELSRINGGLDETGIIGRKASYWAQKYENGGWDGMFLLSFCNNPLTN